MRYQKTEAGQLAFKQRSNALSARQRSAFLLFDGQRPLQEVLTATAGLGIQEADILDLVEKGFLQVPVAHAGTSAAPATPSLTTAQPAVGKTDAPAATHAELYQKAWPIATRLTASLGLRGFRLNLQVEAARGYDDLVALTPAIEKAIGTDAARELKRALQIEP